MRLREIYIDGFGHFHDRTLGPLDSAINVLYGPNEAGKSTLLAFIRTVLFGFKRSGRREFYPPVSGGRHGGRIEFSDGEGTAYTLDRREGPHGGPYVLRTDSGETLTDPAILQRLTGHVSLDLFSNIFAFSLDEIQSEGLLDNDEVSGRLYSAGMGASSLPEFTRALNSRRDALFLPRGSKQQIAVLLRELSDIDGELREIEGHAGRYHQLTSRQDAITREITTIDAEISNLAASRGEIDRLIQGWDDWVALERYEAILSELPEFERFPEDAIGRLEEFQSRVSLATDERDEAAQELERVAVAAEANVGDEPLLGDGERVEAIRRARTSFDDSVHDLPERQGELQILEDTLSQRLRLLGQSWDEEGLDAVNTSLEVRQQVEGWRDTIDDTTGKEDAARIRLQENRGRLGTLQNEEKEAQQKLLTSPTNSIANGVFSPGGSLEELLADEEQIENIRRRRGSFDDSVRDLPERRAELGAREDEFQKRLRYLGPRWHEARLEAFDTSIEFRQETDIFRDSLADRAARVQRGNEQLEREQSELVEKQNAVNQAQSRVPSEQPLLDSSEIESRRNALRTSRSRLSDYNGELSNLENLRRQIGSLTSGQTGERTTSEGRPVVLAALMGLAGVILLLVGALLGQEALFLGVAGALVLFAVAAYLLLRRRSSEEVVENPLASAIEANARAAESSLDESRNLLAEAAGPLELDGEPTSDTLDNAEAALDTAHGTLSAWNDANLRLEEAKNALQAQQKRVERATARQKSAIEAESESWREWREWLSNHELPDGFTPETVVDFTGRVETARVVLGQLGGMRHRVSAIQVDIDEYTELVRPLAGKYGISFVEENHQGVMSVADTLIASFDQARQLVTQRDDTRRRLHQQEQLEATAAGEYDAAEAVLNERQAEWVHWLHEGGFDEAFTPGQLLEFLSRAETAQTSCLETRRMRDRVSAIEVDIGEFRDRVVPLTEVHGITLDSSDVTQLAVAADALIERLEKAQEMVSRREQDRQLRDQQEQILKRQKNRLGIVEGELAEFLKLCGAEDEEDLRLRAGQYSQRLQLEGQRNDRLLTLSLLSGPDERLKAFRESLSSSEREQLTEDSRTFGERIEEANVHRDELRDERVANDIELETLAGEEESSALRIKRNVLMEQLQEQAREWSRLTIAGEILRRTQQKFEQERQPSVIQHAEKFFGEVTGDRYQRLYAPIGQQTITVIDESGRDKNPSQLSRGTREQLYLALRFGLIREFGEHAEHLPVVVDEALVNFDAERASLAASAFAELSETNQVLVFTCHQSIADMFRNVGANVIDIGQ